VGGSQNEYRPSVWEIVRIFTALAVIELINVTTHNDVLAASAAIVVFGSILAWHFLRVR
jgi:hypothetical protein